MWQCPFGPQVRHRWYMQTTLLAGGSLVILVEVAAKVAR
jgi:hypothetical protein